MQQEIVVRLEPYAPRDAATGRRPIGRVVDIVGAVRQPRSLQCQAAAAVRQQWPALAGQASPLVRELVWELFVARYRLADALPRVLLGVFRDRVACTAVPRKLIFYELTKERRDTVCFFAESLRMNHTSDYPPAAVVVVSRGANWCWEFTPSSELVFAARDPPAVRIPYSLILRCVGCDDKYDQSDVVNLPPSERFLLALCAKCMPLERKLGFLPINRGRYCFEWHAWEQARAERAELTAKITNALAALVRDRFMKAHT